MKVYLIVVIICCVSPIWSEREKGQELCYTSDKFLGACVVVSSCSSAETLSKKNDSVTTVTLLKDLQERCDSRYFLDEPIVCCKEAYRGSRAGRARNREFIYEQSNSTNIRSTTPTPAVFQRIGDNEDECRTPLGEYGTCRDLIQCKPLMQQLQLQQTDPSFAESLRRSNKACRVPPPTVCCPLNTDTDIRGLPTRAEGCGAFSTSQHKIVGGTESDLGAWPWIALLGYEDMFGRVSFRCGGVLITLRHVLTAAHCILRDLRFVRMGEHDLTTDSETIHVDIDIVKKEVHSQYSRSDGHSDIGMLYLEKNAPLTPLIKPICLARNESSYVGVNAFVAGWGKTMEGGQVSTVLQEIQIPIHYNSVCRQSYAHLSRLISARQFDSAVLCAGVMQGGVDTCQGDSGGPLMVPETYNGKTIFVGVGLVSYSVGCARPNSPGVYASIPNFINWIEEKVSNPP